MCCWTQDELAVLKDVLEESMTCEQACLSLPERSIWGIQQKLRKLRGLRRCAGRRTGKALPPHGRVVIPRAIGGEEAPGGEKRRPAPAAHRNGRRRYRLRAPSETEDGAQSSCSPVVRSS
ncbi:unnamed protein product [Chrysoparadoxa australica]